MGSKYSAVKFSFWAASEPSAIIGKHFAEAGENQKAVARFRQAGFAHASFFKQNIQHVGHFVLPM
jgi:hypothetical protein